MTPTLKQIVPVEQPDETFANLKNDSIATNVGNRPSTVYWGWHRTAGEFRTPIWGKKKIPVRQKIKTGKKSSETITIGYEYYGTYAMSFGLGPLTRIERLEASDGPYQSSGGDVLFQGTLNRPGVTTAPTIFTTNLGKIRMYWGTEDQLPDAMLEAFAQQPARRWKPYFVADDLFFGRNGAPPNILLTRVRVPNLLDISAHEEDGDVLLPEVVYDYLLDPIYGMRRDATELDKASFEALAEEHISRGLWFSPKKAEKETARKFLGRMSDQGGFFYREGADGRLVITEDAPGKAVSFALTKHDIIKATLTPDTWEEVPWHFTCSFDDRDGTENLARYVDEGASDKSETDEEKEVPGDSITKFSVANKVVNLLGRPQAVPPIPYQATLMPSFAEIRNGDVLTVPHDGQTWRVIVRNVEVKEKRTVQIRADVDRTYLREDTETVEGWNYEIPVDGPAPAYVRLGTLPTNLRGTAQDGLLVAWARPNSQVTSARVDFTWSAAADWTSLGALAKPAIAFTVNGWRVINGSFVALDITIRTAFEDFEWGKLLERNATGGLYVVIGQRAIDTPAATNSHETAPLWSVIRINSSPTPHPTIERRYLIDVECGAFGGTPFSYDANGGSPLMRAPTAVGFMGTADCFGIFTSDSIRFERTGGNHPDDVELKRHIRLRTVANKEVEDAETATQAAYDRDDTTGSAAGTFSPDWGAAASYSEHLGNDVDGQDPFAQDVADPVAAYRDPLNPINGASSQLASPVEADITEIKIVV
ncbi:MAG: hypothetical protein E1N59_2824 [Puniceicoccaceae bacterium 5H]|nr:MAG: hypothetical protein E1N59_2824 [Puniceicoccaceae bacterium 5H]